MYIDEQLGRGATADVFKGIYSMDPDEAACWQLLNRDKVSKMNKGGPPAKKVAVAIKRISKSNCTKFPNFEEMLHNELAVI